VVAGYTNKVGGKYLGEDEKKQQRREKRKAQKAAAAAEGGARLNPPMYAEVRPSASRGPTSCNPLADPHFLRERDAAACVRRRPQDFALSPVTLIYWFT